MRQASPSGSLNWPLRSAQKKATKQAEAKSAEAAKAADNTARDTFRKSWGACLEGRGYAVK